MKRLGRKEVMGEMVSDECNGLCGSWMGQGYCMQVYRCLSVFKRRLGKLMDEQIRKQVVGGR